MTTHMTFVLEADPRDPFVAPGITPAEIAQRIRAEVDSWDRGIRVFVAGSPVLGMTA